jgi:heat shock protein HtpX
MLCPRCDAATARPRAGPEWCPRCEWNLDAPPPPREYRGWLFRPFDRLDHGVGFRLDRAIARAPAMELHGVGAGTATLMLLSAAVALVDLALLGLSAYLIVTLGSKGLLVAFAPLGLAVTMRPRSGRLGRAGKRASRLSPAREPAVHVLVDRIAAAVNVPGPDVVLLTDRAEVRAQMIGVRRSRVLVLGLPIFVAHTPQEWVALIGQALAGLTPARTRQERATQLGRSFFGGLGRLLRPMAVQADRPVTHLPVFWLIWHFVGAVLWAPAWAAHLAVSRLEARDRRRWELRADLAAMRAAGTVGMLGALNQQALWPSCADMINGSAPAGQAMAVWRQRIQHVRASRPTELPELRQLTQRVDASILAGRLSLGRRFEFLRALELQPSRVLVSQAQAARIDAELAPHAEALRTRLADAYELPASCASAAAIRLSSERVPLPMWWHGAGRRGSVRAPR